MMAESKIGPALAKKLQNIGKADSQLQIAVIFAGLPSFQEVAQEYRFLGDKEIVRDQVIRVLKDKAESLHYWLKQLCEGQRLAGQVSKFRSIWIANAVSLNATPAAIREIAAQPNVVKVVLDEPVPMLVDTKAMDWGVEKIGAEEVWAMNYKGQGVTVAVIDTGVNGKIPHPDLASRVVDGKNYIEAGQPPRDDHSHGTHCAGSVAGNGTEGTKTGVAPEATIVAIRVLGGNGQGQWSNLWEAIEEAVSRKINVMSMSLGGNPNDQTIRDTLRKACQTAIGSGVIPVIAAGNSGPSTATVGSPGDVPEVITVGATTSSDDIAYFSSRGPVKVWNDPSELIKPDVCAPGYNITSCNYKYGESGQNPYRKMSGTSMATPHIAGVVALMLSANSNLKCTDIHKIFEQTSSDLGTTGKDNTYGWGRVDALAAVNKGKEYKTDSRWETVVKEMNFATTIDSNGNLSVSQSISNDLMPATVSIWVDIVEPAARKGVYDVNFTLQGPNGTKTGRVVANFDTMANYEPKYGFNCGNFELATGQYSGSVTSNVPNIAVAGQTITLKGKATWPARPEK